MSWLVAAAALVVSCWTMARVGASASGGSCAIRGLVGAVEGGAGLAMRAARSDVPHERRRYGLGFWLHAATSAVILEGYDAGVSFRSTHDPDTGRTITVIANTSDGAWPLVAQLQGLFD